MGQTWQMIAHERRETLGWWGKAGEWVPTSLPAEIIPRLVVPVDLTITVNPTISGATIPSSAYIGTNHSAHAKTDSQLLQLPLEVLLSITAELDLNSLYTLSHCSRALRSLLLPEAYARFRRSLAPWANTPLTCGGGCMETNPPGIKAQIPKGIALNWPEWIDKETFDQNSSDVPIYDLMELLNATNVTIKGSIYPPMLNPVTGVYGMPWCFYIEGSETWENILRLKKYFPSGRRWVLRNLTQKEYVYAHVLTSKDGYGGGIDRPDGEHAWGFDLGTVIAVNTCWSDDDDMSISGLDVRGRWAGNCFDIVVEDKLKEDIRGEPDSGWVDVSHREWERMVSLFRQNYWHE